MEFDFNINLLFNDTISLITGNSIAVPERQQLNKELEHVVDVIGIKSAKAQNLSGPITSWTKLRINSHRIYLLKQSTGNNGLGLVLGFIKVGKKQLFVLDREGNHNELHPLCVLDFYVHESQQRKGYGLKLFKYMLEAEKVLPVHLAIDRPSSKFTSFLRKHFNLWATLPQVNNFVVFDGFFKNRKDGRPSRRGKYQNENDFRPLSRTVSDGLIKRNRNLMINDISHGFRPGSGSVLGCGDQNLSRYQNTGQGARIHMYSRFASEQTDNSPPVPQSRRRKLRQDEEIVTNPYRRTTNLYAKKNESPQYTEENSGPRQDNTGNDNRVVNKPGSDREVLCTNQDIPSNVAGKENAQHSVSQDGKDTVPTDRRETNNRIVTVQRGPRYSDPSDMIRELQAKDKESLMHAESMAMQNKRPPSHWFSSSWNVMGIPSNAKWRYYK